jgi:hypothetical protein
MNIRTAHRDELPGLRDLEVAAGVLFREIGMTDVAEHPPPAQCTSSRSASTLSTRGAGSGGS